MQVVWSTSVLVMSCARDRALDFVFLRTVLVTAVADAVVAMWATRVEYLVTYGSGSANDKFVVK